MKGDGIVWIGVALIIGNLFLDPLQRQFLGLIMSGVTSARYQPPIVGQPSAQLGGATVTGGAGAFDVMHLGVPPAGG